EPTPVTTERAGRWAQSAVFVANWVLLGVLLRVDAHGYVLLGVPLTLVFQAWTRRAPIRSLWLRDASTFRFDRRAAIAFLLLALVPIVECVRGIGRPPWNRAWPAIALLACVPAA